jgi:ammonium transporter, Amt family
MTVIIGYMLSMVLPMRVSKDAERDGLDISSHGERAWDLD